MICKVAEDLKSKISLYRSNEINHYSIFRYSDFRDGH